MSKELVITATPHETRVAILEDGHLCEIYVEREKEFALVGSIYKGRVTRVLPGMQSAFVDIGLDSDAFLYVTDFFENLEEYDSIVTSVEGKVQRMEQQGGRVFAAPTAGGTPVVEPPEVTRATPEAQPSSLVSPEAPPLEATSAPPERSAPTSRSFDGRDTRRFGRGRGRGRWGRRGGREERGGRSERGDRPPRREFPPAKYVPPREPEPLLPADYSPIILPGESLAKYRDRVPATPPPSAPAGEMPEAAATRSEETRETRLFAAAPRLPEASFAAAPAHEAKPAAEAPAAGSIGEESSAPAEAFRAPVLEPPAPEPISFAAMPAAEAHEVVESVREAVAAPVEQPAVQPTEPELTPEEASTIAEHVAEALGEQMESEEAEAEEAAEAIAGAEESYAGESEEQITAETHEGYEAGDESAEAFAEESAEALTAAAAEGAPSGEPLPLSARMQDDSRARFQRPMRRGGRRRGGPPPRRPSPRFQQQRRPQLITELLKAGQEIIVQIAKEPLGKKGARITSHVALPGRFLVYMPTVDHIGVSRKISSGEERSRLRRLLLESKGVFPGGFIVRTAAGGATDDEIRSDVEFLGRTWNEIKARSEQRKAPSILHRDLNLVERILRDHLTSDYTSIWIDSEEEYTKVVEFVGRFQPQLVNRVKLYTKETPIFEEFGIQQEIDKSLRPKVWLKSGGYIVINHTEALVAIDVNTGKFVGKGSTRLEDTIVKTNLEAVKEIVRQIRLRDLGGIIVIDFIDMEERRNRDKVMQALDEALRADKAPSKALGFNEFGLVAITRKRTKQALERVLCQPCPYCTGSGMVKSIPTICYEIQAEARKMAPEIDSQSITLRVNPEIGKALKTRESSLVEELEHWTKKSVIIQSDAALHWEQYDIY